MTTFFNKQLLARLGYLFLALLITLVMVATVRGKVGNPTAQELVGSEWSENGPLELSPERGKYALLYSIVEDKSFEFSLPIARFATPDLGYSQGNYVSLFPPGLSFVLIPGYWLGKFFGLAQYGTYLTVALFALLNVVLIRAIALHFKIKPALATLAGLCFLFTTPAFAYAASLYQHHISTFLLLVSLVALIKLPRFLALSIVWFSCALAMTIDFPNVFFFFPVGLYALGKFFDISETAKKISIKLRVLLVLSFVMLVPPLMFFTWFNYNSYGNPLQLSGTLPAVKAIDEAGKPTAPQGERLENVAYLINPELQDKEAVKFFNTRFLVNGFHTHFLSLDRGAVVYAPLMLLAIFGIPLVFKKNKNITTLLLAIVLVNVVLYSMWGDPYGGWAFGSRYFIPTYAIMSIFLAALLDKYSKSVFLLIFIPLAIYATSVNTFGALTSNRNPPKVEILGLEQITGQRERYTFLRNTELLRNNMAKSLVFNEVAKPYLSAWNYALVLIAIINLSYLVLLAQAVLTKTK